jgi:hypothetical protein
MRSWLEQPPIARLELCVRDLPPEQYGLSVNADAVQPVTLVKPNFNAAAYLPEGLAFSATPNACWCWNRLAGWGTTLWLVGEQVTAVLSDPLVPHAAHVTAGNLDAYANPSVLVQVQNPRAYLRQDSQLMTWFSYR